MPDDVSKHTHTSLDARQKVTTCALPSSRDQDHVKIGEIMGCLGVCFLVPFFCALWFNSVFFQVQVLLVSLVGTDWPVKGPVRIRNKHNPSLQG